MNQNHSRDYNCKDEELPVVCKFAAFSFKRDLPEFTSYSPKFNSSFATGFDNDIALAMDLIEPETETLTLKSITEGIHNAMDELIDPINRVNGYLKLAKPVLNIKAADFGFAKLRKGIASLDAEAVVDSLHLINANLSKHKVALAAVGLTDTLIAQFANAANTISEGKQKQYEILSHRKAIVQNNIAVFNDLFAQLNEILTVGKILYKGKNSVKQQEYTMTSLLKKVRKAQHTDNTAANETTKVNAA